MLSGGKRKVPPTTSKAILKAKMKRGSTVGVVFGDEHGNECTKYAALESWPKITLNVMRMPAKGTLTIDYYTVN